jgi:hypothetical protein
MDFALVVLDGKTSRMEAINLLMAGEGGSWSMEVAL